MPIELSDVRSGYSLSVINENFQLIERSWDEKLDRLVSTQGNQMRQNLDMNGFRLLNAFVGDTNLSDLGSSLEQSVKDSNAARDDAQEARDEAQDSATSAANSATTATQQAAAAEASADRVTGLVTLPVIEWSQGATATIPTQRYLFNNVLYIAPSASATNPITLGATPVGDSDWTDWSVPVYFFSYEEVLATPTATIQLPQSFIEVSDVYVGGIAQPMTSYTVDTNTSRLTFNETLPTGTFVKVWTGRPRDGILTEYGQVSDAALSVGVVTVYNNTLTSASNIVRPGIAFTVAEISVDGVMQIPGASNSYVIEEDSTDAAFEQIRFSETLPVGSTVYGVLRRT